MIFELMSSGTAVKLPETAVPDGVVIPPEPFVIMLLPHNRYIVGTFSPEDGERWKWGKPGGEMQDVFLYKDETTVLGDPANMDIRSQTLPADVSSMLKNALTSQMTPPGDHLSTALLIRGFMRDRAAFRNGFPFQDEESFMECLAEDEVLSRCYWAMRFSLARGEFDTVTHLKAWLKAGPELFMKSGKSGMRIWFSILDTPDADTLNELEELSFSRNDLKHMIAQRMLPILLFNPNSGYLLLSRFGRHRQEILGDLSVGFGDDRAGLSGESGFYLWGFLPNNMWTELRERKKLTVQELMMALWGQHDIERAMEERAKYCAPNLEKQQKELR